MTSAAHDLTIHLVRHGQNVSYDFDAGLTAAGRAQAYEAGARLLGAVAGGRVVEVHYSPTRRTEETAAIVYQALVEGLRGDGVEVVEPVLCLAIRDLDFIRGRIADPPQVFDETQADAIARETPNDAARIAYYRTFWTVSDRMAYWMRTPTPYAETADEMRQRLIEFVREARPHPEGRRHVVAVSHSAVLRLAVIGALGEDPLDLKYGESLTVHLPGRGGERVLTFRGRQVPWPWT